MLNENLKNYRKAKNLSQEELAIRLNVVRQTVSKWEQGLSVPDADMLIGISEVLETPVSVLLGETVTEPRADGMKELSEKLEEINLQLALMKDARRKRLHLFFLILILLIVIFAVLVIVSGSPYLNWDFGDPETAVVGTLLHALEFLFVRIAPLVFLGAVVGALLTRRKR